MSLYTPVNVMDPKQHNSLHGDSKLFRHLALTMRKTYSNDTYFASSVELRRIFQKKPLSRLVTWRQQRATHFPAF